MVTSLFLQLSLNSLRSKAELTLELDWTWSCSDLVQIQNLWPWFGQDLAKSGQTGLDAVLTWPRFGPEMALVPSRDGCSPGQRPSLALCRRLSHKGRPCRKQWTIHLRCRHAWEQETRAAKRVRLFRLHYSWNWGGGGSRRSISEQSFFLAQGGKYPSKGKE